MDKENLELLEKLGIEQNPNRTQKTHTSTQDEVSQKKGIDSEQKKGLARVGIIGGGSLILLIGFFLVIQKVLDIGTLTSELVESQEESIELSLDDKDREIARLKGELATKEQAQDIKNLENINLELDSSKLPVPPKPKETKTPAPVQPKPKPNTARPAVRPKAPTPAPVPKPKQVINPEEQWAMLSDFGSGIPARSVAKGKENQAVLVANNFEANQENPTRRNITEEAVYNPEELYSSLTPGMQGILNKTPAKSFATDESTNSGISQIVRPDEIKAEITLPLVWNEETETQQYSRFALSLKEPIKENGKVIVPKGAVAIAETNQVFANGVVEAYVTALTWEDTTNNKIIRQNITPGAIIVRSEEKEAVIAKRIIEEDRNNNLILNSTIATLANVGRAIAQPTNSTSIVNSNGSLITNSQSDDQSIERRVAGAVLEGFFDGWENQIAARPDNLSRRNTPVGDIYILEDGYDAQLIILEPIEITY